MQPPQASSGMPVSPVAGGDWQLSVRASPVAWASSDSIVPPTNKYAWPSRPLARLRRSNSVAWLAVVCDASGTGVLYGLPLGKAIP